jgi:inner membrane protein
MDNLCHSLIGGVLAETGLKRRTALGTATLVIGANFPDIDVVAVPFGAGLTFRRGWTHGVLALVVLPFVLAGLMTWWARRRLRAAEAGEGNARPRELLLLAFVSILTHPTLDYLNVYGVRWLMPFSSRWFYGDSLFIVDPWLWVVLLAGVVLARRARSTATGERIARVALGVATLYMCAMIGMSARTRARVAALLSSTSRGASGLMVAPVAVNPFLRDVVYDAGDRYGVGRIQVFTMPRSFSPSRDVLKGRADPAVRAALERVEVRDFLRWARFPFFEVTRDASGIVVRVADARYASPGNAGWASVTVRLPRAIADPQK